jgi:hypothetical protein
MTNIDVNTIKTLKENYKNFKGNVRRILKLVYEEFDDRELLDFNIINDYVEIYSYYEDFSFPIEWLNMSDEELKEPIRIKKIKDSIKKMEESQDRSRLEKEKINKENRELINQYIDYLINNTNMKEKLLEVLEDDSDFVISLLSNLYNFIHNKNLRSRDEIDKYLK